MNKQRWIAFDQWLHTLCYDDAKADETFSARCWREKLRDPTSARWCKRVELIDKWALRLFNDPDHCRTSYESEMNRNQLPEDYKCTT